MDCKTLIEYLSEFNPEATIGVVVVDLEKRIHHKISKFQLLVEMPVLLLETERAEPLDTLMKEESE